jgi:hypothetical protein
MFLLLSNICLYICQNFCGFTRLQQHDAPRFPWLPQQSPLQFKLRQVIDDRGMRHKAAFPNLAQTGGKTMVVDISADERIDRFRGGRNVIRCHCERTVLCARPGSPFTFMGSTMLIVVQVFYLPRDICPAKCPFFAMTFAAPAYSSGL